MRRFPGSRTAIYLAAVVLTALMTGHALAEPEAGSALKRYSFSEVHMGMSWKVLFYSPNDEVANRAARAMFTRVAELDKIFSDYNAKSELSLLCAVTPSATAIAVSDDLWRILERSQQLSEQTDGAFDVTAGPATRLWRRARRQKELPTPSMLAAAREAMGYRSLQLDPAARTVRLLKPEMRLDLGAIGAGYAVDEAMRVLSAAGVTSALIDASGDILASNAPPGEKGWRIGIIRLSGHGPPSRYVQLANAAMSTSGDAFQGVDVAGIRYSHIVDPRTAMALTDRISVTVIARDCVTADSLATAASVLGARDGMKLIESTPGTAACIIRQAEGEKLETIESPLFSNMATPIVYGTADPNAGH